MGQKHLLGVQLRDGLLERAHVTVRCVGLEGRVFDGMDGPHGGVAQLLRCTRRGGSQHQGFDGCTRGEFLRGRECFP